MKKRLLDYWEDDEYIKEVTDAGYEDILILAQMYIIKYTSELIEEKNKLQVIEEMNKSEIIEESTESGFVEKENKSLPKSENKLQQHKPIHRPSMITEDIIDLIKYMRKVGHQSCREISETLYSEFNFSIHFTTVSRILKGTYTPMLKNETKV